METLRGNAIYLRALEPEDVPFLYALENDVPLWEVSQTQTPYSTFVLTQYLENAYKDIYEVKQLRLAICKHNNSNAIGLVDLFDFDPKNQRVGIGIVIQREDNRQHGYGREAVELVVHYAFDYLHVHQLYANIATTNGASRSLFLALGFQLVGVKKDWNCNQGRYSDEAMYQLIR